DVEVDVARPAVPEFAERRGVRLDVDPAPAAVVEVLRDRVIDGVERAHVDIEPGRLPGEGALKEDVLEVVGVGDHAEGHGGLRGRGSAQGRRAGGGDVAARGDGELTDPRIREITDWGRHDSLATRATPSAGAHRRRRAARPASRARRDWVRSSVRGPDGR